MLLACFAWLVGLCARVELGGFMACCVFAFRFSSFAPVFASFYARCPSLLWLSFFVLLHCLCGSLGVVVVSFSLSDYTQKERAQVLASSLVLLWVALFGCCFVLCELVRTQSVNIVTKFYIKIFAAGAANFFALACVLTCIVVFPFHISCV